MLTMSGTIVNNHTPDKEKVVREGHGKSNVTEAHLFWPIFEIDNVLKSEGF